MSLGGQGTSPGTSVAAAAVGGTPAVPDLAPDDAPLKLCRGVGFLACLMGFLTTSSAFTGMPH